jgi:hypothetical protein
VGTVLGLVILCVLKRLEKRMPHKERARLCIHDEPGSTLTARLVAVLRQHRGQVDSSRCRSFWSAGSPQRRSASTGSCTAGRSIITFPGNPLFDALGGIAVSVILMGTAFFTMREIKSLIVGESAHESVRADMHAWLSERPEIARIVTLVVLRWAGDFVVAKWIFFEPELRVHGSHPP